MRKVQELAGTGYCDHALETALQLLHTSRYDVDEALRRLPETVDAAVAGTVGQPSLRPHPRAGARFLNDARSMTAMVVVCLFVLVCAQSTRPSGPR